MQEKYFYTVEVIKITYVSNNILKQTSEFFFRHSQIQRSETPEAPEACSVLQVIWVYIIQLILSLEYNWSSFLWPRSCREASDLVHRPELFILRLIVETVSAFSVSTHEHTENFQTVTNSLYQDTDKTPDGFVWLEHIKLKLVPAPIKSRTNIQVPVFNGVRLVPNKETSERSSTSDH